MPRAASALVPLLVLGWGLALQPALVTGEQGQCQNITVPLCSNAELGYNLTRMPNLLGHNWQDEAGSEVHQFFPLVKVGCSKNLKPFLCQLYVPECEAGTNEVKPPCRELCEDARDGCEPLMTKFGFRWPESMDCDKFPSAAAGEACGLPAGSNVTIAAPTPAPPSVEQGQCEQIRVSMCQHAELGYNLTRMPNLLGHEMQGDARREVRQYFPLVEVGCSENIRPFLCQLYVPECEAGTSNIRPPCRELCENARNDCGQLMRNFGIPWPEVMACDKFPSAAAGGACGLPAGSNIAIASPTPAPPSVEPPRVVTQQASPPEPSWCGEGSAGPGLAALEGAMERLVGRSTRVHQLQEETLMMQQQNMRLERRKLELEIRLLERQLRGS